MDREILGRMKRKQNCMLDGRKMNTKSRREEHVPGAK
jgi:hypothetical protein